MDPPTLPSEFLMDCGKRSSPTPTLLPDAHLLTPLRSVDNESPTASPTTPPRLLTLETLEPIVQGALRNLLESSDGDCFVVIPVAPGEEIPHEVIENYLAYLGAGAVRCEYYPAENLHRPRNIPRNSYVFVLSVPSLAHERLTHNFGDECLQALREQGFWLDGWDKRFVHYSGSCPVDCRYGSLSYKLEPDASLVFQGDEIPWLVIEVATSERAVHVQEKVRPYLLGTRGAVKYLVVIHLRDRDCYRQEIMQPKREMRFRALVKAEIKRLTVKGSFDTLRAIRDHAERNVRRRQTLDPEQEDAEDLAILSRSDHFIHATVSCYTWAISNLPDGRKQAQLDTLVHEEPVWPSPPRGGAAFTIRWKDFDGVELPDDKKDTEIRVPFVELHRCIEGIHDTSGSGLLRAFPDDIEFAPLTPPDMSSDIEEDADDSTDSDDIETSSSSDSSKETPDPSDGDYVED
ncbi:hypothetical protein FN846DRAFT_971916 [Sphaerosporella brunnea]|uniref:Restriction endonuclease domain-containing protein n=1 Tax=Sphaerosporella brunnea TaxID=1250544 RepID=A0A5J5EJ07_9PEZI|nr:hypothetical protein FN846DRAFT_971916 [Sphaerosporella brunnea]